MNKIYSKVWNKSLGQWVVASELAGREGSATMACGPRVGVHGRSAMALAVLLALGAPGAVLAVDAVCINPLTGMPAGTTTAVGDQVACGAGSVASGVNAVAVGVNAIAATDSALAVGDRASATGLAATALGFQTQAEGEYSVAIGSGAQALGYLSYALGNNAQARDRDVAVGAGALTGSTGSAGTTSIGYNSGFESTGAVGSVFIGATTGNNSAGQYNTYVGYGAGAAANGSSNVSSGHYSGALATGSYNVAGGNYAGAAANGNHSVAQGTAAGAAVIGSNNVSIGYRAGTQMVLDAAGNPILPPTTSTYSNAVNIGTRTQALADDAVAVGTDSSATAWRSAALGVSARATGVGSLAAGASSQALGNHSVALGDAAQATATQALAAGSGARATHDQATAVGHWAHAGNGYNTALGAYTQATGGWGTSLSGNFSGSGSVAIGSAAWATNVFSIALGTAVQASGLQAIAIGVGTRASGSGATAVGGESRAQGDRSFAGGNAAQANGVASVALGDRSVATADDSIALGAGSIADTAAGAVGYDPVTGLPSTNTSSTWISTLGAVSVGNAATGDTRQITNLAAGTQATDAVNVAQLQAAQTHYYSVNDNGVVGGNYNNDGATGVNSMAAGVGATATGYGATAVGMGSRAVREMSLALGYGAAATGHASIVVGSGSASGYISTAMGYAANASGEYAMALGYGAAAGGQYGQAVGFGSRAAGNASSAFGYRNFVRGANSSSFGNSNWVGATSTNAIALGSNIQLGSAAGGFPEEDTGNASYSVAIGDGVVVNVSDATAVGSRSSVTEVGGVALGSDSVASTAAGISGYDPRTGLPSTDTSSTWVSTLGVVSVGNATTGDTRQITNLAAGTQATDAVNVAQLQAAQTHYYSVNDNGVVGGNYNNDGATGVNAMAAGVDATATGRGATAVGAHSRATSEASVALGDSAAATGAFATVLGSNSAAVGEGSIAVGSSSFAIGEHSIVLGTGSRAQGVGSSAMGLLAYAWADGSLALGTGSRVHATNGVALGSYSVAITEANGVGYVPANASDAHRAAIEGTTLGPLAPVSVGTTNGTRQIQNVAAGTLNSDAVNVAQLQAAQTHYYSVNDNGVVGGNYDNDGATGTNALAAGVGASASGSAAVAVGWLAHAQALESLAMGANANALGAGGVALGSRSTATYLGTAIGQGASATDSRIYSGSTAIGAGAQATGDESVAIGGGVSTGAASATGARANGYRAIALGTGANVTGNHSIQIGTSDTGDGYSTFVSGNFSGTFGSYNTIRGDNTYTIGNMVNVGTSERTFVAGHYATANDADDALGLGSFSSVDQEGGVALGSRTQVHTEGGVALGYGSVADTASFADDPTRAGYVPAGAGAAQQAAIAATHGTTGALSVGDAANGMFRQITSVAAGTEDSDAVNVSQLRAVESLANAGWNVADADGNAVNIGPNGTVTFEGGNDNIAVVQAGVDDDGVVEITLNNDLDLTDAGSLTIGTTLVNDGGVAVGANVALGNTGLTIIGAVTTTEVTATGLTSGTVVLSGVSNDVTGLSNTTLDAPDFATAGRAATEEQLALVSNAANAGWNVTDADGNAANIGPNGTVTFEGDANLTVTQAGGDDDGVVEIALNRDIDVDSVTAGDTIVDTNGVAVGANVVLNDAGLVISGGPSVTTAGIDAGGMVITNVAAGVAPTDAVNVSQLEAVEGIANAGWNVADGDGNAVNIGPNGTVTFQGDANLTVTQTGAEDDGVIEIALNRDIDVDSVTAGDSVLDTSGLTVDDGAGNVSTVGAGTISVADATGTTAIGGNAITVGGASPIVISGATGTIGGLTNLTWDPGNYTSGQAATEDQLALVSSAANAGWNVADGDGNAVNIGPDGTVTFEGDANLTVTQTGAEDDGVIEIALNRDIDVDRVTAGDTIVDTNGVAVGADVMLGNAGLTVVGTTTTTVVNGDGLTSGTVVVSGVSNDVTGLSNTTLDALDFATVGRAATEEQLALVRDEIGDEIDANRTHYYSVNSTGGGNEDNDGATGEDAIAAGKDADAEGDEAVAIGYRSSAAGDGSIAMGAGAQALEFNSLALGAGAVAGHANSLALGAGSATTVGAQVGYQGAYVGNSSSTGEMNIGGRQITGVAAGSAPTDAVNVSQLQGGVEHAITVSNEYTDTQIGEVSTRIDEIDNRITTIEGDIIDIRGDITDIQGDIVDIRGDITDLGDRVTTVEGDVANLSTTVNEFDNRITNVGNGADGMFQVSQEGPIVKPQPTGENSSAGGNGAVASGDNSLAVGNQSVASGNNSTAIGQGAVASHDNSVALGQGSTTTVGAQTGYNAAYVGSSNSTGEVNVGGRTITGVAPGIAGTDAVNVNQLNAGVNHAIREANNYTDNRIDQLQSDIWISNDELRRDMNAAVASALAVKQAPWIAGKTTYYAGVAGYRDQGAIGLSLRRTADNGRWSLEGGFTQNRDGSGAYIGISGVLGR